MKLFEALHYTPPLVENIEDDQSERCEEIDGLLVHITDPARRAEFQQMYDQAHAAFKERYDSDEEDISDVLELYDDLADKIVEYLKSIGKI